MNLRLAVLAGIASGLLAWRQGLQHQDAGLAIGLALLSLLGAYASKDSREKMRWWHIFWLLLLTAGVSIASVTPLLPLVRSFETFSPVAFGLVRPTALTISLLLGYTTLAIAAWRGEKDERVPFALGFPFALTLAALSLPPDRIPAWVPLVAALGVLRSPPPGIPEEAWSEAPSQTLQMAAMQTVGWGAAIALGSFVWEMSLGRYWSAVILGFGSGVVAWLLSGLIWGLSLSLEEGRGQRWAISLSRTLLGAAPVADPGASERAGGSAG